MFSVDKSRLEAIADIDVTEGSLSDLGGQHIAVLEQQAAKRGWKVSATRWSFGFRTVRFKS